jgi:hypothetical protein
VFLYFTTHFLYLHRRWVSLTAVKSFITLGPDVSPLFKNGPLGGVRAGQDGIEVRVGAVAQLAVVSVPVVVEAAVVRVEHTLVVLVLLF